MTDSEETTAGHSRKALLVGVTGGVAAFAASALARPEQAKAGTDGDVVLGGQNTATHASHPNDEHDSRPVAGFAGHCAYNSGTGIVRDRSELPCYIRVSRQRVGRRTSDLRRVAWQHNGDTRAGEAGTPNQVATGNGVEGSADGGAGVRGTSASGNGTEGISSGASAAGVSGDNQGGGYGAVGGTTSATNAGVWGNNYGSGAGVKATSSSGDGVFGQGGNGVHGVGIGGTGGFFTCTGRMVCSAKAPPPASTASARVQTAQECLAWHQAARA